MRKAARSNAATGHSVPMDPIAGKIAPQPTTMTPEQQATNLQEMSGAAFLYGTMGELFGSAIDGPGYKAYRDSLLADAGSPTDPIEIMLVEQLILAHNALGRLHCKAANATQLEATQIFNAAAARLSAEFRKSSLALAEYRLASQRRKFGIVGGVPEVTSVQAGRPRQAQRSV